MQFEPLSARPRMFRYCRRRRESNPLFRAVLSNDLTELQALVESDYPVNTRNEKGSSLLNFVMRRKRCCIFDYLLSLKEIDVNFRDGLGQSPLLYLAGVCFDEYFALELLRKGADVHMTDDCGYSFLHLAAKGTGDDTVSVGRLIIEKGADVNRRAEHGVTPLYIACEYGNFDWVFMLLYYGADPTIPSFNGVLPITVLSEDIPEEQQLALQEQLFLYTFDEDKVIIRLPTLIAAMTLNCPMFPQILDKVSSIDYDTVDLQHLVSSLIHVRPKHLRLFIDKYGFIVEEMLKTFPSIDVLTQIPSGCDLKEILDIFLSSDYIVDFIQSSYTTNSTIAVILDSFSSNDHLMDQEEITKMICQMLSYGLNVTSIDLDAVFRHFGYCELFKILLHMDVIMTNSNNDRHSMAVLFYDPLASIDDLILDEELCTTLLDYYNHPKLKEYIMTNCCDKESIEKVKNLAQVPLLIELSRNVVRQYIVNRFYIENSNQFYTILQRLPIGEMNRSIIALERKLY